MPPYNRPPKHQDKGRTKVSTKTEPYDQPKSLMLRTIELLKERELLEVWDETRIPFYWLRKFASGAYQNPSVNRVQHLYEHLSQRPLV
jgi:hypothetical protein